MPTKPAVAALFVFLFFPASLFALPARSDTTNSQPPVGRFTADTVRTLTEGAWSDTLHLFQRTKSPGLAMLLSAALPGAGQFYNESYWKVPVVAGLGIYFVAEWISCNNDYHHYRDLYGGLLAIDPRGELSDNLPLAFKANGYLALREFYRDQRDSFTWYFLVLYIINIADAYVDASLFDFNVGPDLSLQQLPSMRGTLPVSLTVRFRF